jgi:hypothetical protein
LLGKYRKNTVLTEKKIAEIQLLYNKGHNNHEVSEITGVKYDTIRKSIKSGRIISIREKSGEEQSESSIITKGERSVFDDFQGMGKACTNTVDRVLSCKTGYPCNFEFEGHVDLDQAGILFSLPSLLANGLLRYEEDFHPNTGYYSVSSIFLSLAFLALLRVKTLAQSRTIPAGELGRAMGLDRIPEVKTLRERIALFCQKTDIEAWGQKLSKDWLESYPELSGVLYIDGHVNIYYGQKTSMPKRYVSRLRLCMSGSTDYWVNDNLGQPFFVINKTVNTSMIEEIKNEIVPRLDKDVPNQPTNEELVENAFLHRYMLVFDRECYSPDFFFDLWNKRIAICTYSKNVKDKWPEEEFVQYTEENLTGVTQQMELAERGVLLQNKNSDKKIWAREIRKKTSSGHQTSIITTNFKLSIILIGIYMFARWSQENFFKYVMENFGIDTLVSYLKEKISDTTILINPVYRALENQLKKLVSKLNIRKTKFASIVLGEQTIEENKMKKHLHQKAELNNEISFLESEINQVKEKKKQIPRKIMFAELPENEKFENVINQRKLFLDTIKIIAYRAETSMANIIKSSMSHPDEARMLLQQVYKTDANLYPDYERKILTVELFRMTYWKDDLIIEELCQKLNETETTFPGTDLTLFYKLVSH